jgi:hypothetical protein
MTPMATQFTKEADKMLRRLADDFGEDLLLAATEEAFVSRGEPVEVTASDVMKARARFWKAGFKDPEGNISELLMKTSAVFAVLGVMSALGEFDFFQLYELFSKPVTLLGLSIAGVLYLAGFYFKEKSRRQGEEQKRTYPGGQESNGNYIFQRSDCSSV